MTRGRTARRAATPSGRPLAAVLAEGFEAYRVASGVQLHAGLVAELTAHLLAAINRDRRPATPPVPAERRYWDR
jgi:hypothetical protein